MSKQITTVYTPLGDSFPGLKYKAERSGVVGLGASIHEAELNLRKEEERIKDVKDDSNANI